MSKSVEIATSTPAGTGESRARIHDLGYRRYLGTRRPQATRWRVIMRHVIGGAWVGWWRMKLWVIAAVMTTVASAALMFFLEDKVAPLMGAGGVKLPFLDAILPMSLSFFTKAAFMFSLTVGATIIARDLRAGAFEFYFSRPVRPIDYVAGKLSGLFVVAFILVGAGPLLLALFRLGLATTSGGVSEQLPLVGKTALVSLLGAAAYSTIPLAFSTLSAQRFHALGAWAAFYFVVGGIGIGISHGSGAGAYGALDIPTALTGMAYHLFDAFPLTRTPLPPLWACITSLVGFSTLATVVVYVRVAHAQRRGLGGG